MTPWQKEGTMSVAASGGGHNKKEVAGMRSKGIVGYATIVCALVLLGISLTRSYAQTTYATIVGTVRDPSAAVMPGVTVTVTNDATGEKHTQPTNEVGAYAFTTLFPGTYSIHAEMSGFRPIDIRAISLQVNQTARYDLTLEVGPLTQSVEVQAAIPVLATETTDIGQVISNKQVMDLPLNGRNYIQLAGLTNGVILTSGAPPWGPESGGPNLMSQGGRVTQNSFLVDGVETRIQREGRYGLNLSIEAIQEFKVMQNSLAAEYGRATTVINAAIKSGTNELHGTVFEFLRNDKFDANNFFSNQIAPLPGEAGAPKAPLRFNQFGASVGGPIRRDRTFFMANFEGRRERRSSPQFRVVPTPEMLDGDLSGLAVAVDPDTGEPFTDNQIPDDRIVQFARAAKAYYPAPNSTGYYNYVVTLSQPINMTQFTTKIDHTLSDNDRLNGQFTYFNYNWTLFDAMPSAGFQGHSKVKDVSVQHTHSFNPRLLNDFRFGFVYTDTYMGPDRILDHDVTPDFGLKNLAPEPEAYAAPAIYTVNYSAPGSSAWIPNGAIDRNLQFVEQLAYVRGRHSMKWGTDLRWYRYRDLGYATQNGYYCFYGGYTGNDLADLLLGLPQEAFANQAGGKGFSMNLFNGEYSFYFQDSIKLLPSLTLNAGLRYEYVQWPLEKNDELATWNFEKGFLDFAGEDLPRRIAPPDRNNWGPRLGLAYTVKKKTVIRAGSGVTYGNFRQWEISLFHFNPPFVYDNFQFNDFPTPRFTVEDLWPPLPATLEGFDFRTVTVNYQSPDKVLPVTYQWNFNIEHELPGSFLFEVGYVGNRGLHYPNRWDANQARPVEDLANPTPVQSRRPYQDVGFVSGNTSRAWSNYNALTVRLERRFTKGFGILGTYTWSKAMGIREHDNYTVMDINNIRHNYGPVNDYTHNSVISYVWELPFGPGKRYLGGTHGVAGRLVGGWQVNGITNFRSGNALELSSPVSSLLGNRASNKPDRLANGNLPPGQRKPELWFDTDAFVDPPQGRYGNAGSGIIRGPGYVNWDLSLFNNIKLTEDKTLQFRFELFNAFNKVNWGDPGTSTGWGFGMITWSQPAREIQFGLKFIF